MMLIIEEASEVPDPVFEVFKSTMTGPFNFGIIIFNPLFAHGAAYDTHYGHAKDQWIRLHWNCEESERVSKSHIEAFAAEYGKDSNPYRIHVLGLPPLSDKDGLIPSDWVYAARDKWADEEPLEQDPLYLGIDVGCGGDKSVFLHRRGKKVTRIVCHNTKDTMFLADLAAEEIINYGVDAVFIDNIGIGQGVYDQLRRNNTFGERVFSVDVRNSARKPGFERLRDELWWTLREQFEAGTIAIPPDQELIDQLSIIGYDPTSAKGLMGKIKVEGKRELIKRGRKSPDKADALMMTYYYSDNLFAADEDEDEYASYAPSTANVWTGY
jgi:hypothetical protein